MIKELSELELKAINTSILLIGPLKKNIEKITKKSKKIGIKNVKLLKEEDKIKV